MARIRHHGCCLRCGTRRTCRRCDRHTGRARKESPKSGTHIQVSTRPPPTHTNEHDAHALVFTHRPGDTCRPVPMGHRAFLRVK
eukprot:6464042-Prymnesium_polylepis.1